MLHITNTDDLLRALDYGPYAWPGGYPLYFITHDGCALSFDAVQENRELILESVRTHADDGWSVVAVDINWEDPCLYCEHTNVRIPSAYAEDEVLSDPWQEYANSGGEPPTP